MAKQDNSAPYTGWNLQTGLVNGTYFQLVNTYGSNFIEVYSGPQRYADNTWHLITATYDGSTSGSGVKLYFDGQLDPSTIGSGSVTATTVNSVPVYIGSRNAAEQFMNGQIDDPRIYNYVLSEHKSRKSIMMDLPYSSDLQRDLHKKLPDK